MDYILTRFIIMFIVTCCSIPAENVSIRNCRLYINNCFEGGISSIINKTFKLVTYFILTIIPRSQDICNLLEHINTGGKVLTQNKHFKIQEAFEVFVFILFIMVLVNLLKEE